MPFLTSNLKNGLAAATAQSKSRIAIICLSDGFTSIIFSDRGAGPVSSGSDRNQRSSGLVPS